MVEYGTSWILEVFFHARWWDYSGQFLNLHGRICFVSIVGFSLIGLWAVQAVVPVCAGWIQKLTYETRKRLCLSSVYYHSPPFSMGYREYSPSVFLSCLIFVSVILKSGSFSRNHLLLREKLPLMLFQIKRSLPFSQIS